MYRIAMNYYIHRTTVQLLYKSMVHQIAPKSSEISNILNSQVDQQHCLWQKHAPFRQSFQEVLVHLNNLHGKKQYLAINKGIHPMPCSSIFILSSRCLVHGASALPGLVLDVLKISQGGWRLRFGRVSGMVRNFINLISQDLKSLSWQMKNMTQKKVWWCLVCSHQKHPKTAWMKLLAGFDQCLSASLLI